MRSMVTGIIRTITTDIGATLIEVERRDAPTRQQRDKGRSPNVLTVVASIQISKLLAHGSVPHTAFYRG
jgi:hypothetical protein